VAATKSFLAQLAALYLLSLSLARMDIGSRRVLLEEIRQLPNKVRLALQQEERIAKVARDLAQHENVFFVARGINLPVALEGALKLKEISYIHAEGYPAGELKHGPFALLTPQTPVIAVVARDHTYETLLVNIKEIKARESPVLAIVEEEDKESQKYVDQVIPMPQVHPLFSPVVNSVALQLLAYYAAKERGCPIDMPRNLAKSVTVE
jgi:glucosamine--fructose-6-phosphate aminotransferase (isomerizing)